MTITKCKECDGAVSRKARNLPALMRIATALIISLMLHTQAVADNIPTQQHNPSKCPLKDDPAHKACMAKEAKTILDMPLPADCAHGTFVSPAAYELASIDILKREVFGPILHVVRFAGNHIGQVCEALNATGFGLTLGLHTRIESTVKDVRSRVRVGNMYVNRNQIGAVVGAQPFGGEGLSGTGPKAGGAHYMHRFATERVCSTDTTASGGNAALMSMETK